MVIPQGVKEQAVREHLEQGESLRDLATRYGVSHVAIGKWVKLYSKPDKPKGKPRKSISTKVDGLPDIVDPDQVLRVRDIQDISGSLIKSALEAIHYCEQYRKYYDKLTDKDPKSAEELYERLLASSNGVKLAGELAKILKMIGIPGYDGQGAEIKQDLYQLFEIAQIAKRKD